MKRLPVLALACLLAVVAYVRGSGSGAALADDAAPAPAPASAPTKPAVLSPMKLTLTSAGAEPKKALRYRLKAGTKDTYEVTQSQKTATTSASGPTVMEQTTSMKYDFEVLAVDDASVSSIKMSTYDLHTEIVGMPSAGNVLEGLRLGFTGRMSSRGAWTDTKFVLEADPSGKMAPILDQLLAGMGQAIEQASVALPEEPVGLGATWTLEGSVAVMGMAMEMKSEMTIASLAEGGVRLVGKTSGGSKDQTMTIPQPQGAAKSQVHVVEMKVSGDLSYEVDLARGLPTSGTVTAKTSAKMGIKVSDDLPEQALETDGTSEMKVELKR